MHHDRRGTCGSTGWLHGSAWAIVMVGLHGMAIWGRAASGQVLAITNPAPAASDFFGSAIAAMGTDRLIVGATGDDSVSTNAGSAYLIGTNGQVMAVFTNPAPAISQSFGGSVAGVGAHAVIIADSANDALATNAGVVHLFTLDGRHLRTFQSPSPADFEWFGSAVAAVGTDRFLVGARGNSAQANSAGAVYLFHTNGSLIRTIANPSSASGDLFGIAVAAMGDDRLIVGTLNADKAYLFSTSGVRLATFTNPAPGSHDFFGGAVAAVGIEGVLVGAEGDDSGVPGAGAAYLFSTNGTLQRTFLRPGAAMDAAFGCAVAGVGADHVLIGAYADDAGATEAGAAYLFGIDGTLRHAFTNPAPGSGDWFGINVAPIGTHRVAIGAHFDNAGASDAGTVYLFDTAVPPIVETGPSDATVPAGADAVFAVSAGGTLPLQYQWQFNLEDIPGATNPAHTVTDVEAASLGYYRVVVSNQHGRVVSREAALGLTEPVFADDFEGGTLSNWWVYASTPLAVATPGNRVPEEGQYSAVFTSNVSRMHRNLVADLGGQELSGHSRVTFWMFQTGTTTRSFCEVRGYAGGSGIGNTNGAAAAPDGSLEQLLALGIYNSVTLPGEIHNPSKYQGRVKLDTDPVIHWFNLDGPGSPNRSGGWHKFQVERLADGSTVRFLVDDVLCRTFTNVAVQSWDTLVMGGGLSVATNGLVDGWLVERFLALPVITAQPVSRTNAAGSAVSFQVTATGTNLTYRWRRNGENLSDGGGVSGATTAELTLSGVQASTGGDYSVIVIGSGGPVSSSNAILRVVDDSATVNAPAHVSGQGHRFEIGGVPGVHYIVEATTNLADANWAPLVTNPAPFIFLDVHGADHPQRFYRVVERP